MTISIGSRLPDVRLLRMHGDEIEEARLPDILKGRKVVLFAVPGAFTGTCTNAHVPSYIRSMDALREKGVQDVICLAVNDPFVVHAWGEATGGREAGIVFLADPAGDFAKAVGKVFDHEPAGLYNRSSRYSALVEDGVVTRLFEETSPGVCEISAGGEMLRSL